VARGERRRLEHGRDLLARILKSHPHGKASRGRVNVPAALDVARLAPLPESWTWVRIDVAGDVLLGRQRAPQYHAGETMRPYLRVANVFEDRLDLSDVKTMHFDDEHFAKYKLEPGDILLNEGQTPDLVGRPAMFRGEIANCCFQKTLHRFRPSQWVDGPMLCAFFEPIFTTSVSSAPPVLLQILRI
jgi:type I restriction enzyme, S subunit